jgi:hypothetical protein
VTARNVAGGYGLGGRDSLILANFLANHIAEVYTHDGELLELRQIEWRGTVTKLIDPVTKSDGIWVGYFLVTSAAKAKGTVDLRKLGREGTHRS